VLGLVGTTGADDVLSPDLVMPELDAVLGERCDGGLIHVIAPTPRLAPCRHPPS